MPHINIPSSAPKYQHHTKQKNQKLKLKYESNIIIRQKQSVQKKRMEKVLKGKKSNQQTKGIAKGIMDRDGEGIKSGKE
jgi:biopolymer transport protein ExbD